MINIKQIVKEACERTRGFETKRTKEVQNLDFPRDTQIVCPLCKYEPASARIYSRNNMFICFACNRRFEVK